MVDKKKPFIAISIGDFCGIGAEVILKTISETDLSKSTPVIISPREIITHYTHHLHLEPDLHIAQKTSDIRNGVVNVLHLSSGTFDITPGKPSAESGKIAIQAVEKGIELCMQQITDALVTAPISKKNVNEAGYKITGHTEFLAEKTNGKQVLMMLISGDLRVALVTTHLPVKDISSAITGELIKEKINLLASSLKNDFGIQNPKIAVFGLNPHAGDGGVIGMEEIDIITPAIQAVKDNGIQAQGPFPADGFFGQQLHNKFDAILAMYHDQGLAPFKLLSFGNGVNFSAGLPIIRTSPDHGTAFDIAGKGIANINSFKQAYNLAVKLSINRLSEN